jgi:hypothetical protein
LTAALVVQQMCSASLRADSQSPLAVCPSPLEAFLSVLKVWLLLHTIYCSMKEVETRRNILVFGDIAY